MVNAMARTERIALMSAEQWQHQQSRRNSNEPALWALLDQVRDPEIPALSIWEMGILVDARREGERVVVVITPTYSGCPAVETIDADIRAALRAAGYANVEVRRQLSPAWTTAWMTDAARARLEAFGIAAPPRHEHDARCPHCGSREAELISEFSATACKAMYRCRQCREPFELFKSF